MKRDIVKRFSDSMRYTRFILKKKKKEQEYEKLRKEILGYEVKPKIKSDDVISVKKAIIVAPFLIEKILSRKKSKTKEQINVNELVSEIKKLSLFTEAIVKLPATSVLSAGSLALIYKIKNSRKSIIKEQQKVQVLEDYFIDKEISLKELEDIKLNLTGSLMELDFLENDILKSYNFFIDTDEVKNVLIQINKMKKEIQDKQIEVQLNIENIKEKEYQDDYNIGGKSI
ncbi:MAG: hypothetical protein WDA21_02965 [Bacilli bacterium]